MIVTLESKLIETNNHSHNGILYYIDTYETNGVFYQQVTIPGLMSSFTYYDMTKEQAIEITNEKIDEYSKNIVHLRSLGTTLVNLGGEISTLSEPDAFINVAKTLDVLITKIKYYAEMGNDFYFIPKEEKKEEDCTV